MYQFELTGKPFVQQRTRHCSKGGKMWVYNPSQKDMEMIQWQIRPFAPETPLTGAIELTMAFFMPIPSCAGKALREQMINRVVLPTKPPDIDNMAYLVTNALKKIVYEDDDQVVALHCYKFYGATPKTVIRVAPVLQAQPFGHHGAEDIA